MSTVVENYYSAKGPPIKTLADARDYLLNLPKDRHDEEVVQAAIEVVIMAADGRGPILHAMRASAPWSMAQSVCNFRNRPGGQDGSLPHE